MKYSHLVMFWSPFPISTTDFCMDYFSSFFRQYGNIQCLFCSNTKKEHTINLLLHADLMVVVFHQKYQELRHWFTGDFYRFTNCLYLIIDYIPEKEFSLLHISREFRIPLSHLVCVPYNPEYQEAARKGNIRRYWRIRKRNFICPAGMNFYQELYRTARLILHALDRLS